MKKITALLLALVLCMSLAAAVAETMLEEFNTKLSMGSPWTRYDYNVTYQKSAKDVLPAILRGNVKQLSASQMILFADGTGEVYVIYGQEQYRVFFTVDGRLVFTSTSEGFGWTGYAIYTPSSQS